MSAKVRDRRLPMPIPCAADEFSRRGSDRGAAEAGTDEQVGEDGVVLHEFEGETPEVISGGLRWQ